MDDHGGHSTPHHDRYDAVVVGAGLGGLSAAALLARSGRRVLVAEQGHEIGGYAQSFRRGPYTFDPAIHVIPQAADGMILDVTLRHLGVRDRVAFLPVTSFYDVSFPDLSFSAPHGSEAFAAAHAALFPHERPALDRFLQLSAAVHAEAHALPPQVALRDLDRLATEFPNVVAHQKSTLAEVLEPIADPRLRALLGAGWPYGGEPPSRMSFLTHSQILSTYLAGAYYCQGGFANLAAALAAALRDHGGELLTDAPVDRVVVEGGAARGVVLADGTRVDADVVVSNADARTTLVDMVDGDHVPSGLRKRLDRMEPSYSAFIVFAVCRADLVGAGVPHETFVHAHDDVERGADDVDQGRPGGVWVSIPSITDPSLAPPGEHVVIIISLARPDIGRPWEAEEAEFTRALLAMVEQGMPVLRGQLDVVATSTPDSLRRRCRNSGGAIYGWANTPRQAGSRRLSHATPVPGLYLSGHWTQPGAGSLRVFVSGIHTAFMIMAAAGESPPPLHASDTLPPIS